MFFLRPDVVGLNVLKYTLLFRGHVETSKGRLQHRRCNSLYKFTGYFPKNLEGIKYKKIIKWFSNSNSLLKILNKIIKIFGRIYQLSIISQEISTFDLTSTLSDLSNGIGRYFATVEIFPLR